MSIASAPIGPHPVTAVVLAKWPRAGHVKTRLCPPLTHAEAASLASAALVDTLDAVEGATVAYRAVALDVVPHGWSRHDFQVLRQRGDGLDERLAAAFADIGGPAVLVGMDTPQLDAAAIDAAATALLADGCDAVLGPAIDGGFWLVGLREPNDEVFLGVPMSRADTGAAQLARLRATGRRVTLLGAQRDVDDIDDALAVAREAPSSRFARRLSALDVTTTATA